MMRAVKRLLEIRDEVARAVTPVGAEPGAVALEAAAGRYLAEAALAAVPSPPASCSAMDGYALRAADAAGRVSLPVVATVFAGDAPAPLPPGAAARIYTGAPLPEGADTVVREEAAREEGGRVSLGPARPGESVRRAGEDVERGALALPAGTRLGPLQRALLVSVGVARVRVHRRPRVALLATGDEIVRGRTPDSNGVAVAGLLAALGAEVRRSTVPDRKEALVAALDEALAGSDAVVTLGGVSVGAHDLVPGALAAFGAEIRVHGVPMKPGKPFLFALARGKPVFGLPGSPSACLVAFEVLARPALLAIAGALVRTRPAVSLRLAEPVAGRAGRARVLWAVVEPDGRARPVGRDAAQVRGPALANALLVQPDGQGDLGEGEEIVAWLLDDEG